MFNVSYLVLEGLRSQSFVEWCEISGEILKVALYLLLLIVIDRFRSFGVNKRNTDVIVIANISH